jgi:hypothetical protein
MISESEEYRRRERGRLLWSLLASVALNTAAWMALSAHLSVLRHVPAEERLETLGKTSQVHIEYRPLPQPRRTTSLAQVSQPKTRPRKPQRQPRSAGSGLQTLSGLSPPQPAALALPPGWAKQDFGNKAATDTTVWLQWTKQRGAFVPRVFLWQRKADPLYMRRPTLQDAVQDVLTTLRAHDAKLYTSKAQRLCGGERPGWFFSYVKPDDDPPAHFDETLFFAGDTIYRATYIRPADQPEDTTTREALNTLCAPHGSRRGSTL